jgi:predicted nuclease of restriction endonuclease-like (RecB) superfamily
MEFGHGFSFAERQKRMIADGEDIALDLLFCNRILRRLVAVELKLGRFKADNIEGKWNSALASCQVA